MNKKISTLLAGVALMGAVSANAQWSAPENNEFVFLNAEGGRNLVVKGGQLDSIFNQETNMSKLSIIELDSMAWKVTVKETELGNLYKFQNRVTGDYLSLEKKTGGKLSTSEAITEWGYDDAKKALYVKDGPDSTYYVVGGASLAGVVEDSKLSTAPYNSNHGLVGFNEINVNFNLTADDFNNHIKGFSFAAVNGREDDSEPTGKKSVLTDNEWVAISIHGGKYITADEHDGKCDTLFFQKKSFFDAGKDSVGLLGIDTGYIKGTYTFDLKLFTDSAFLRRATGTANPSNYYKAGLDSLHMFTVAYDYKTDSMSIMPVALPVYQETPTADGNGAKWYDGGSNAQNVHTFFTDHPAVVGLRTLSDQLTILAVDSTSNYTDGEMIYANIHSTTRSTTLGGDAEISLDKVYFIKKLNEGDDKGKYAVANQVVGATAMAYEEAAYASMPSTQWVVKAGTADGLFELINREFPNIKKSGAFSIVKDEDGKAIENTYAIAGDTLLLEDANCAAVEGKIAVSGKNYATTGYGYYDPEVLANKTYKVASASPFMKDLFMQAKADSSIYLGEEDNYFYLEEVGKGAYGAQVKDVDSLYRYSYKLMTKKDEFVAKEGNKYILTKDGSKDPSIFLFKSWGAADNYLLVDTADINSTSTTNINWADVDIVSVNAQNADIYPTNLGDKKADLFTVTEKETPSMLFSDPAHYNIYNNNDRLAMGANNLAVMAQPGNDLKADADKFVNDNFTLWFDTVNYKKDIEASYFISQGIKAAEGEEEAQAEEAAAERMYLTVAHKDTVANNKELYSLQNAPRLYFRTASRYGVDSLIVSNFDKKAGALAPDTVCAGVTEVTFNKATGTNQLPDIDNFKFRFEVIDGTENYFMKSMTGQYVVSINGLLVAKAESDENMIATLNAPDYATSSDEVAVSEVTVIAGKGKVTIANAAGKKVVISNILGQTVANTIITSDNATIAAPAGVVVVAVEGEEAVKAIVK